jgi:cytochrome oxidase Cu insertion factor (SCO1/SenC/PrrC family)
VIAGILLACLAPLVAAYLVYALWPPERQMNYGELIEPLPLPQERLQRVDGRAFELADLKGRWILVQVDEARCAEACRTKLYQMRQVRLTQGRDMQRIERLWLVADDAPVAQPLHETYAGTHIVRGRESMLLHDARDHIYLIDPLGNLMLSFPRNPDPSRMKKDLERLLKVSRVG